MEPQAIVDNFRNVITRHYFDFEGRVGRKEFWYYILAYVVLFIGAAIVQRILFVGHFLTTLMALVFLLPNLGMGVRRLHDIDRSGWWILIGVVPGAFIVSSMMFAFLLGGLGLMLFTGSLLWLVSLAAAILLIYWCAQPGTSGANQFGPEPATGIPSGAN